MIMDKEESALLYRAEQIKQAREALQYLLDNVEKVETMAVFVLMKEEFIRFPDRPETVTKRILIGGMFTI